MHDVPEVRRPGALLAVLLFLFAALHAYWAVGGTWGLDAALGGPAAPRPAAGAVWGMAVALLAFAASAWIQSVRHRYPRPVAVLSRIALWLIAIGAGIAGVMNLVAGTTTAERLIIAPFCLAVAALAGWTLRATRARRTLAT